MFGKRPLEKDLYGTWKILRCESLDNPHETLVGTEFRLEEGGDLAWKLSPGAEQEGLPFFACETYELQYLGTSSDSSLLKFYGSDVDITEFRCTFETSKDGKLLLSYDHYLKLVCDRVTVEERLDIPHPPYSLLNALQEGFFSDVTITTKNGRKFAFHKTIVACSIPDQNWSSILLLLSELSPDVLEALLHYFYNNCLPKGLAEDTANGLLSVARKMTGQTKLVELCEEYIDSSAVRSRINALLADLRHAMDYAIKVVSGIKGHSYDDGSGEDLCPINPAKLCGAIKVILREMATGALKFTLLCDLFNKRKTEVTREERHQIIQNVKESLPGFAEQVHRFLVECRQCFADLTAPQKEEIAAYLIPEIEMTWDKANSIGTDTQTALDQILNATDGEHKKKNPKPNIGSRLSRILRNAIHTKEMMALKKIHEKTTSSIVFLQQKRESYATMPQVEKIRIIVGAVDKITAEIPDHISTMEKFPVAMKERLTWKDWKHFFKVGAARVSWFLGKIQRHKDILKPLAETASELVNQEAFTQTAAELCLMDPPPATCGNATTSLQTQTCACAKGESTRKDSLHLNSATTPPPAAESTLAQALNKLLSSGEYADMKIVVGGGSGGGERCSDVTTADQIVEMAAHRVVVASRCEWFRRALMSGMKESIDRKIAIPDTSPELFRSFLSYLYSGVLDTESMSEGKLVDMLALADKYETDSLKQMCEISLYKHHISEDSVLDLLCIADRYSAATLKRGTFNYIKAHPDICERELFEELPQRLQQEVMSQIYPGSSYEECDSAMEGVFEDFASCNLVDGGVDEIGSHSNRERLEECIRNLREVLGDSVSRSELVRMTVAADYDVNRAVNFHFSR